MVEGEVYLWRLDIARWFSKHSPLAFDVYGPSPFPLPNYRGALMDGSSFTKESKYRTLAKYKFSVAFENIYHPKYLRGYISEKKLDCFEARIVPIIYLGCTNVEEYIPSSCLSDMRTFPTYQDLSRYLISLMDTEVSSIHRKHRYTWVEGGNLSKYSWQGLYDRIVEIFARMHFTPYHQTICKQRVWISFPVAKANPNLGMEITAPSRWTWAELMTDIVS